MNHRDTETQRLNCEARLMTELRLWSFEGPTWAGNRPVTSASMTFPSLCLCASVVELPLSVMENFLPEE